MYWQHTAENVTDELSQVTLELGIKDKVVLCVSNKASSIKAACENSKLDYRNHLKHNVITQWDSTLTVVKRFGAMKAAAISISALVSPTLNTNNSFSSLSLESQCK